MFIEKKLSNGLRIVIEKLPEIRSVTLGIWVGAGSVYEEDGNNGISHFIEHMLFKGTEKRTYKQIAEDIDNIGGQINAFTGKECTCFYAKVIDEKQSVAVDVLTDIFMNSRFDEKELNKEKGVVIEEINMNEDDPEDVAHERMAIEYFKGTRISRTILGPAKNIKAFKRSDIAEYMRERYTAENTVVVAVGNVDTDALCGELEQKMGGLSMIGGSGIEVAPEGWSPSPSFLTVKKDTEQINICMGFKGYAYNDKRKFALSLVSQIFGGSMSSRLFQSVREQHGLAYSVYSYPSVYSGAGTLTVYAGTSPDKAEQVTNEVLEQAGKLVITEEEFRNNKEQMRGSYILSQESMSARMNSIGKVMLLQNRFFTEEDMLGIIDKMTLDEVLEAQEHAFAGGAVNGVYVGNCEAAEKLKGIFV